MTTSFNSQINNSRHGSKNALLKVVILGDGGVGKSCLMNRFVNNHFDTHSCHTVGVEFFNKDIGIGNETYTLQVSRNLSHLGYSWSREVQELTTPFYRGSDICMLTYAINDRESFTNLNMWKDEFVYYADIKNPGQFPFLVVGNKLDLADDKREVETSYAKCWSFENGDFPFIETSAKDATNVATAFAMAVERWLKLEDSLEKAENYGGDTVTLKRHTPSQSRSTCCLTH